MGMEQMINLIISTLGVAGILGAAAFLTSLIVEATKEFPGIKKIYTQVWAYVVALIVCVTMVSIYIIVMHPQYAAVYLILCVFAAFVVMEIAIKGWEYVREQWKRFTSISMEK